jgi:hypothetical protein
MKTRLILSLVPCLAIVAGAADEITANASVRLTAGGVSQSQSSGDLRFTMTNSSPLFSAGILATTTTKAALPKGSVTAPGYLWVKNTATNFYDADTNLVSVYVDMGPTNQTGEITANVRLMAGEIALVPLAPDALIYFQANTNTLGLQYYLITR